MKYTNLELQTHFNTLNSIASKVTGKLAYLVTRNARKIAEELKEYTSIRDGKIREYGEADESGRVGLAPGTEGYDKFLAEMAEYDGIEQEVEYLKAAPADLFSSDLNAVEMDQIMFMIEEGEA